MSTRVRRTIPAALVMTLLGAGLSVGLAPPASADTAHVWAYDAHAAGMPTTSVPARTLLRGEVWRHSGDVMSDAAVDATIELGAEPDAESDATLHLVSGVNSADGCDPRWHFSLSTYDPGVSGTREGTTLRFRQPVNPEEPEWSCSFIELVDDGDAPGVLDRLDGHYSMTVHSDPGPAIFMTTTRSATVPVRRWDSLRLKLWPRSDVVRVVIDAHSKKDGVRARKVVLDEADLDQRHVRAWLPIKLKVDERRYLLIRARAWDAEGAKVGVSRYRVRLVPRG